MVRLLIHRSLLAMVLLSGLSALNLQALKGDTTQAQPPIWWDTMQAQPPIWWDTTLAQPPIWWDATRA